VRIEAGAIIMLAASLLAGCSTIPKSAVELAGKQAQLLEEYHQSVKQLASHYRRTAQQIVRAKIEAHEAFAARAEGLKQEFYRLAAGMLKRDLPRAVLSSTQEA